MHGQIKDIFRRDKTAILLNAKATGLDMRLLSNAPLGEDLFEGKPQELIADAIVEQLKLNANQRNPDLHLKMIGIEGAWGSGKSNLVEIVKKKLTTKNKKTTFHFFTYDVWGHQEDLQRKAILDELVNDLIKNKVIKDNSKKGNSRNWKERVKNITGTFTETTRKQIPSISIGFLLCTLALTISPICVNSQKPDGIFWTNIAPWIPLALFIIALIIFIKSNGAGKGLAEFIYSCKGQNTATTERTSVHEKNPSVIDFENLLRDLSNELIGKHLIIFFDNIDRLPEQKVKHLWSSIHTFFAENNGYANISCIVAFDREHVKDSFSLEKGDSRGNDYIDKTFDVVFRVAAPVLSDWKKFFERKWKEAFDDEFNPTEYDHVIQAYSILSEPSDLAPRSIIRFINECVLLKRIFNDIPERYIAIFNLRKDDLLKGPLDMRCLDNLQSIYEHDPKYYDYITALVFQVPPEKAISVVYKQALYKALEQHNQEALIDISQTPFFKDILEDTLNYFALLKDPIVSLDEIGKLPLTDELQKKLWRDLYFRSVKSMQFDSGRIEPYQIVLLKQLEKELKTELIQKILAPFKNIDFSGPRDIFGQSGREYTSEEYVELLKNMEKVVQRDELKGFLQKIPIKTETHKNLLQKNVDIDWIPFECK